MKDNQQVGGQPIFKRKISPTYERYSVWDETEAATKLSC